MFGKRNSIQWLCLLALPVGFFGLTAWPGAAQQPRGSSGDKAAIAKNGEAFVEAFHKGDAKALAALWAPNGDYTDQTGKHLKGRDAIGKAFRAFFAEHKGLKVRIDSISLSFLTPDVAVEDGISEVIPPNGAPPSRARYTIVHVKKDGHWLVGSVRDAPYAAPTNYEHLRGLEWAVGDWAGERDKGAVERLTVSWAENQNFLHATFTTTVKDIAVGSAHQWIGWDPLDKRVRSWIFDAAGGFGEGAWARDGKKAAATYVLAPVDAATFTLQGKDRTVDGEKLPDTKAIQMKRVK